MILHVNYPTNLNQSSINPRTEIEQVKNKNCSEKRKALVRRNIGTLNKYRITSHIKI